MSRMREINKLIITKIKEADTSKEVKDFLMDIFSFERDYFNEDMNRFSAQYRKYADFYIKKMRGTKK